MKEDRKQELGSYLRAVSIAVDRKDYGSMFAHLRIVLVILESEGFDTKALLPAKRGSFAAFTRQKERPSP